MSTESEGEVLTNVILHEWALKYIIQFMMKPHGQAVYGTRDREICTSSASAAEQRCITFITWLNPFM